MTNPVGAPSKYREAYCNEIITHCESGKSLESFAAEIGVTRITLSNWAKAHPEFLIAAMKAKAKAKAKWENILLTLAETGTGNATAAIFGITNMSRQMDIELPDPDWVSPNQKIEHTGKDGGPIVVKEVSNLTDAQLEALAALETGDAD